MIESAKKLRELSPLLVEGRGSRPFKPSNARPAFSTLPNPVILSGAGSSAKRMIQRSRRTPTLFGGCPWLLISPARQAPGVPNPSSTLRRVGVGMLTQRDEHTSNRRHRVPPLQRTQGQGTQVLTWGLAHPFPPLTPEGGPSLSRFLRQGGDFDFLNAGIPRYKKFNRVPHTFAFFANVCGRARRIYSPHRTVAKTRATSYDKCG